MKRLTFLLVLLLLAGGNLLAQESTPVKGGKTVTFSFSPGKDAFILQGNETELTRLYSLADKYHSEITSGRMPVYVDGYCASLPSAKENLNTAYIRANRVKSELITHKSLKEAHFITKNYAVAWQNNKDVVVVTLCIPTKDKQQEPVAEQPRNEDIRVVTERKPEPKAENQSEPATSTKAAPSVSSKSFASAKPYVFAVRTNLLHDAFLLPTLGIEWRVSNSVGIKLDGALSWWGGKHDKVQKMWLLNPEVRWYLLNDKRFYVGASGSYSEYNIYKYMIGNLLKDDTGYQGKLWNAGLTVGYQLPLSRHFSVDFNLGLGYTRSEYDSFGLIDGVRVYKGRDRSKSIWGPTQAGINFVWTIGGK